MSLSAFTLAASTLGCTHYPDADTAEFAPTVLYQDRMQRFDDETMTDVLRVTMTAQDLVADAVQDLRSNQDEYLATMPETFPMNSYGSNDYIDTSEAYTRVLNHLETGLNSRNPADYNNWNVGYYPDCATQYACTPEFDYCQLDAIDDPDCSITHVNVTHAEIETSLPWLPTFIDEKFLGEDDFCEQVESLAHETCHSVGVSHEPDVTEGAETAEDVITKDIAYRVGAVFDDLCEESYE